MTEDPTSLTRDELNEVAADAGVPDPEGLPNKQAVIDALPNPALEPEPVQRVAQTYKVIGNHTVHDTPPGGTFTLLLSPQQEDSLTYAGHIKRLDDESSETERT